MQQYVHRIEKTTELSHGDFKNWILILHKNYTNKGRALKRNNKSQHIIGILI